MNSTQLPLREEATALRAGPGWDLPGEALARFAAPTRSLLHAGSLRSLEFTRYGFRVAGIGLLIAQGTDAELVQSGAIAPIPRSSAALVGMMNRRGHPVPVFDLRAALELRDAEGASDAAAAAPLLLILGKGDDALALEVDSTTQALRGLVAAAPSTALPAALAAYSSAAWLADAQLWFEFDHRAFFAAAGQAAARR